MKSEQVVNVYSYFLFRQIQKLNLINTNRAHNNKECYSSSVISVTGDEMVAFSQMLRARNSSIDLSTMNDDNCI